MLTIRKLNKKEDFESKLTKQQFIDFLYEHLGKFGDTKEAIEKSIDYEKKKKKGKGGFLLAAYYKENLVGELIINNTGMSDYIPEHFLVYVAVDSKYRGKGFGGELVKKSIEICEGNVALHVEYDNPAKRLYERLGFYTKYAEMRYNSNKAK